MAEIREISESTKKALTGLAPISLKSTVSFTPDSYKIRKKDAEGKLTEEYLVEEAAWPIFKMRPWTKLEGAHIKKNLSKMAESKDDSEMREYIRRTITGWENLIEAESGDDIPFESEPEGGVSKELFGIFPTALITDLLNKALSISGIADFERMGLR